MQLPVIGYEHLYEVTETGHVWSIVKQIYLKPTTVKDDVLKMNLSNKRTKKRYTIHSLVAKAFIPNPNNKPQIDHIDGNKHNNAVSNLRWCTNKENQAYRAIQGNSGSGDKGRTVTWGTLVFNSIRSAAQYIANLRGSKKETVRKELKAARYGDKKLYGKTVSIT